MSQYLRVDLFLFNSKSSFKVLSIFDLVSERDLYKICSFLTCFFDNLTMNALNSDIQYVHLQINIENFFKASLL